MSRTGLADRNTGTGFLFATIGAIAFDKIDTDIIGSDIPITSTIFTLATFLPGLSLAVRRLHDLDRSGWWCLVFLIPLIGVIILIIWFCSKGTDGPNRFGPDRLAGLEQIRPRPAY
ncbi:MAG TPA: DUF805 domain-containing protein [Xanthobacteraceae bacterium]